MSRQDTFLFIIPSWESFSQRLVSAPVWFPIHTPYGLMNLWDEALWEVWQHVLWELAFELEHQGFYSWLLHGQAVSLKVYIQKTWTWITLTTLSSFSCLKLYYMTLYSSAHGHRIGFLLALDRNNINVFHQRRWVAFCRCLAQTDQKRTSSVQRHELLISRVH